ncbi:MAG: hypothetical protein HGB32_15870 [Geobacteraceae bacterium]|nr:hypothetical protein [Geobacteraceae bacterium]NTW81600.1 hypothetical protein [Geobacteraceae bacterium]
MNATIIHKTKVTNEVLDHLATTLPDIISDSLELPGGKVAILKPEQVSLEFSQASPRDTGSDIKIMLFAKRLILRSSNEKELAKEILDKVVLLTTKSGEEYSIDVRLYLMDIGAADHSLGN